MRLRESQLFQKIVVNKNHLGLIISKNPAFMQDFFIYKHKNLVKIKHSLTFADGELAEWSIAAVLKTVVCYRTWGSNP